LVLLVTHELHPLGLVLSHAVARHGKKRVPHISHAQLS
jgi:hypothetical protein